MQTTSLVSLLPFKADKKHWWIGFPLFVTFLLTSQIAALSSPTYIWDDLVWYWTYHIDGSKALFDLLDQVGHPAFWPFINFAYRGFGEHATLPTTIIGLVFHAANSVLIFHLMRHLNAGRVAAFLAFVFYLVSPYYFNRGTVSHYFYDIFTFFFLFSIYLGAPNQKSAFKRLVAAPIFLVLYFGLPTLVMLEPFRLAVHWELCERDYKKTIDSIAIYWLVAALCAVTAFMVFKPFGYYEGYNELNFSIGHLYKGVIAYLLYPAIALLFHAENVLLVLRQPLDWPFVFLLVAIAFGVTRAIPVPEKEMSTRNTTLLLLLGAGIIFLGAVPYILAGRLPAPQDFNSRLFFVSGLGLVIMVAVSLGMIRTARHRNLVVLTLVGFFLASGLQQAKAYMYDHIVRQSILLGFQTGDVNKSLPDISDQNLFVVLASDPPLWELFTQGRMVTPMEFSVPVNIDVRSGRGKWFIYNYDARDFSPPDYFIPPRECSLAAHDRRPCPANYIVASYRLDKDEFLTDFSFAGLFYQSFLRGIPIPIGHLEFTTEPRFMDIDEMAVRWYRKEAEKGVSGAQNSLGLMYLEGFASVLQDDRQAFEWFSRSAAQGILDARLNLGAMYLEGRGTEKNEKIAVRLIYSAAQDGYAKAEYNLAVLYEQGRGVPKSDEEAFRWYLKAAEQGHILAQTQVGLMYARGAGVPRRDTAAIGWLRMAADKREKTAEYALAVMLAEGRGVSKDIQTVVTLLEKSASQGYPQALSSLGYMYKHGIGVPKSSAESYFWYRLASRYGVGQEQKTADKIGLSIGRSLTASDRKALDERVDKWRPLKLKNPPMWH